MAKLIFNRQTTIGLAVAVLAAFSARPTAAQTSSYIVTVNTSSVTGTNGFLDFQFNPGNATSQPATAQIFNFMTDGTLTNAGGTPQVNGSVAGTLQPGPLTFTNSTALNEFFQGFTYGTNFSFLLVLSGPAIAAPNGTATAGSTFGLALFDMNQNPILTNQPSSFAGQVDINLNGTTTATAFPTANGGPSVVTFTRPTPPTITKSFADSQLEFLFGSTALTFTVSNPASNPTPLPVAFTDTLPSGLVVSSPSNGQVGTCDGGMITAVPGSGTISLSGATLASGASCTFSVRVMGSAIGVQTNTVVATSPGGLMSGPATATISVVATEFMWFFSESGGGGRPTP